MAHARPVVTGRLQLEPLRAEHAQEMAPLLAYPGLHAYIRRHPETPEGLLDRYRRQVLGRSPDGRSGG